MGEKSKEKILQAALAEFLKNGFEKAKVEDIAKRAGLTKMMLYYHFSSKENMMSELMAMVMNDIKNKFRENLSNIDAGNPQSVHMHIEKMMDYFYENKDIIRLIISETLKSKNDDTGNLSMLEEFFNTISMTFAQDRKITDRNRFLINIFFFNALPMVMYSSLSDNFNHDFNIGPEKSRQLFIETFTSVFYRNLQDSASDSARSSGNNPI